MSARQRRGANRDAAQAAQAEQAPAQPKEKQGIHHSPSVVILNKNVNFLSEHGHCAPRLGDPTLHIVHCCGPWSFRPALHAAATLGPFDATCSCCAGNTGFWVWYLGAIALAWLVLAGLLDDAGLAWTYTHLLHGILTYYLFHWIKGTPFVDDASDHGRYQSLTFWEQVDDGQYATPHRKLLSLVPVGLFVLATHGTDFRKQPLGLNLVVVLVLLIAKLPALDKVRIFGINR